jgi:hypothetical protein
MRASILLIPVAGLFFTACQTTTGPDQFRQADLNRDDKLSREEASGYLVASNFASLDTNKDHVLTKKEANPSNDPKLAKLFSQRDANRDGKVTLEEAQAYARKKGTTDPIVNDADANKDGIITRAEAAAYIGSKEGPIR